MVQNMFFINRWRQNKFFFKCSKENRWCRRLLMCFLASPEHLGQLKFLTDLTVCCRMGSGSLEQVLSLHGTVNCINWRLHTLQDGFWACRTDVQTVVRTVGVFPCIFYPPELFLCSFSELSFSFFVVF